MENHILNAKYGINNNNVSVLAEDAKDWALFNGIGMKALDLSKDARVPLTFCLVPSLFPKKYFDKVHKLQPYINYILYKVSLSKEIIKECLSNTIEADEFTRNIFKIYEAVENKERITLGLIRTDYLLHSDSEGNVIGIKQVENNTIASSFGGLAPIVKELHSFILNKLGQLGFDDKLPLNESCYDLAKGILAAWDLYENANAVILFVVEDETLNICDQRALEYKILDFEDKIQILRCTFKELRTTAVLKEDTLYVKDKEVAVVYYRTGYVPQQYEPEDWETRFLIERSRAIKCPSVGLHLAGTKKVQAYLSRPGVLEKFVVSNIAEEIREVFVGQYSLDIGPNGDIAFGMAIENPTKFVLKPEREGGGNNVYGAEIKAILESMQNSEERNAYILMERINPPVTANCIIQKDKPPLITDIISELGIFGVILGNKDKIFVNEFAGHLLRSKNADSDECGIAAGFGALDSPYLD